VTTSLRQILYGNVTLSYELRRARRKTLSITVHPDQRVSVAAPLKLPLAQVEAFILQRAPWIIKKQRQFALTPHPAPRQYVSGETHRYLGRQYRLKVVQGSPQGVRPDGEFLWVQVRDREDPERVRRVLEAWYRARAAEVYAERLDACWPRVKPLGVPRPTLTIRAMRSRWGSARRPNKMTLNLKLVQAPLASIDYVILHELCHFLEPNHSARYYQVLERVLPDWRARKAALDAFEF
jgi:predicted metal-dependent hydrolase